MATLADSRRVVHAINPADVTSYCDGVELFFRKYPKGAPSRIEECFTREGYRIGWRTINCLKHNQLTERHICELDAVQQEFDGKMHRFDIAVDLPPIYGLRDKIAQQVIMKWRRRQPMQDSENVTYLCAPNKRHPRNFILYDDRHSKITGELKVVHLELRFRGTPIIRKQGIKRVRELLTLNPKELFQRHIKLSDAGEKHVQSIMRQATKEYRDRYQGRELSRFMDRYIASIPR